MRSLTSLVKTLGAKCLCNTFPASTGWLLSSETALFNLGLEFWRFWMLESNSVLASFRIFEGGPEKFQETLYSKGFNYEPSCPLLW